MTKKEMENKKAECIAAGRVKVVEKTDTEEALLEFFRIKSENPRLFYIRDESA